MSKVSFLGYVKDRLGGFEVDTGGSGLAPSWQAEFDMFPEYYADYFKKYSSAVGPLRRIICQRPDQLRRPGAAADRHRQPQGGGRACRPRRRRRLHAVVRAERVRAQRVLRTHEEYLDAVAEAMREEYLGIVDAGFILQVDDPWLIDLLTESGRAVGGARRAPPTQHVEALNHALRDIPTDKIRHHTCYGLNHGPRLTDIAARQGRCRSC